MANEFTILARVRLDTADIQSQLDRLQGRNIGIHADTQDFELSISVANAIMNEFIDIARDMVEQVAELDSAITEFRKVSDLSGESLDNYVSELGELGKQVARTTSEMVDGATQFKKSGFTEEESKTLALIAAEYQNIADEAISSGEAANFIISQIKAFNIEATNAEHIINAVNAVSNNFAVSSADLATNIGKASAALAVGGNTYEETLGLMTSITEINRNGSRSARALVSIQSRLNQVLDETSSTGKKLTEWYESHNIALYDEEGQLRSLYDIMGDVAKQWDTLSENEQRYFLLTQAGANQSANLGALLTNFETAINATTTALNSNGSALKENAAYMDSIEARTNLLKADFQTLAVDIIDSKLVKSVLSLSSSLLQLADTGLGQTLIKIGMLSGIGWGATSLLHVSNVLPNIIGQFTTFGNVLSGLESGTIGLGTALVGLHGYILPLIAIGSTAFILISNYIERVKALDLDIDHLTQSIGNYEQRLTTINQQYQDNIANTEGSARAADFYINKLEDLGDYTKLSNEKQQEYHSILETLIETVPSLASIIDLETNSIIGGTDALRENTQAWKENAIQQAYQERLVEVYRNYAQVQIELTERQTELQRLQLREAQLTNEVTNTMIRQGRIMTELEKLKRNINPTDEELDKIESLEQEYADLDIQLAKYKDELQDVSYKDIPEHEQAIEALNSALDEASNQVDITEASMAALGSTSEETGSIIETNTVPSVEQLHTNLQDINDTIDAVQAELDVLNTAQEEYNETGGITVDTLQKLLELDAEYINALFDENGQLNLNADTISGLIDGKNVLLDRLAAEAIATYAVEEADRQLANQMSDTTEVSNDTAGSLEQAALAAIESGAGASFAADAWANFYNIMAGLGSELDNTHFQKFTQNVQSYASNVLGLISSVKTGLGGWKPTGTGSGSHGTGSKRTGGSKTSTTSQKTETELIVAAHNDLIARLESEYSLLEAQGASSDALYKKAQEIRDEYNKTITELQNSEEYLNNDEKALKTVNEQLEKWYNWQIKVVQEIKKANESYETIAGLLESEFNLMEHQGKSVDELVAKIKEIQNNLHQQAEYYRDILAHAEEYGLTADDIAEIQTKINKLGSDWWEWQDKLNGLVEQTKEEYAKLLEEFQKTLEAQEASLNAQKDAILALQGAMQDYYQGQIDDIDAQIQGLQNANSELEKQVELEEKLDALARAKQQKVLAYVNGSWQYINDPDATSKAQKDLDELKRQRKLEEEIAALESEKQVLEELRDSWGNMTDEYEKKQDEWLIAQELGINTALDGWQRLVEGASYWATQYMGIMQALTQNANLQSIVASGGVVSTAGVQSKLEDSPYYNKSYNPNVDYSAKILNAETLDEVIHWAGYRDAKIAGEGLTPEHDTQWFIDKWKAEHPGQYASGTLSATGGLSLVGEHGAELRVLNRGDGIVPSNMTKNLMKWGSMSPSQYAVSAINGNGKNMSVTIQTLSLPNVLDGQGFVDYVKNNMFGQMLSFVH